jgi:hypothetical protein
VFYSDNTFSTFDPSWDYYKLFGDYDNLIDTILLNPKISLKLKCIV